MQDDSEVGFPIDPPQAFRHLIRSQRRAAILSNFSKPTATTRKPRSTFFLTYSRGRSSRNTIIGNVSSSIMQSPFEILRVTPFHPALSRIYKTKFMLV